MSKLRELCKDWHPGNYDVAYTPAEIGEICCRKFAEEFIKYCLLTMASSVEAGICESQMQEFLALMEKLNDG